MNTEDPKLSSESEAQNAPEAEVNEIVIETPDSESENSEIEKLKAEIADHKDKYLRLFAEFDNYKRRTTREKLDLIHTAAREVLQDILPVVDDLERAQKLAIDQKDESLFPEGIKLVYQKLISVLKSRGVNALESNGLTFDANEQEAITEIPAPDESLKGKVIDTLEKGYKIHDKILRFAKVVVGK